MPALPMAPHLPASGEARQFCRGKGRRGGPALGRDAKPSWSRLNGKPLRPVGREGAAVVAMREPGLQRKAQKQGRNDLRRRGGDQSGPGQDVLREVRELKEKAAEV